MQSGWHWDPRGKEVCRRGEGKYALSPDHPIIPGFSILSTNEAYFGRPKGNQTGFAALISGKFGRSAARVLSPNREPGKFVGPCRFVALGRCDVGLHGRIDLSE